MTQRRMLASVLGLGMAVTAGMALAETAPVEADAGLIAAVQAGDVAAVKAALRQHAPVNAADGDGSTALHWAAYEDNPAIAKLLLGAHADVNATTRLAGMTPLFMASQTGDAALIDLLVKAGANANQPNALGTTPLMMAAASGNAKAVDALVAHGAEVNAREGAHDQTALMFAANLDRGDAIRALIAHGADPNLASKVTPATKFERPPAKKGLVDIINNPDEQDDPSAADKPAVPEAKNGVPAAGANAADAAKRAAARRDRGAQKMGGFTPLVYAARQGAVEATRALIEGHADINEPSGSEQSTPLVMAIHNGHYDVARVLVEHGADVNKANVMGLTPLFATIDVQWAPHQWSPEPVVAQENTDYLTLMKMLIDHGANVNARLGRYPWFRTLTENQTWTDLAGATAFWRAAWALDVKAMQLLKDAGADTTIPTSNGTTPLMAAAGVGWAANYSATAPSRMDAVKFVLANGGQVTAQDNLGFTALHGAGFVGDLQLVQYLVDLGAKTDVKTKAGDYPADSANGPFQKSLPHPDAVALLEKLGSPNSHNCRSSECVPPINDNPKVADATRRPEAPAVAPDQPAAAPAPSK